MDNPVLVDIAPHWPMDENGQPRSVNWVYLTIKDTSLEVGRGTLTLALHGRLDRGKYENLKRLAELCSKWTKKPLAIEDLFAKHDGDLSQ